jgi:hypothetical protein
MKVERKISSKEPVRFAKHERGNHGHLGTHAEGRF